ncbi:MAG TPA: hypothetical protein PL001_07360, partial [Candidatus Kryptobacter bacterium]|nr:hypothetical protein [Candidatus Kryptobacter bacterium]
LQLVNMERAVKLRELLQQVDELKKNLIGHKGSLTAPQAPRPVADGGIPGPSLKETRPAYPERKSPPVAVPSRPVPRPAVRNAEERPSHVTSESSFQEINVRWDEFLLAVRGERIGVWSQLINLKPLGVQNGWLMLGAPNEVVIGMTKPYKTYIQDAILKTLGARVAIDFTIVNTEQPVDTDSNYPLV